MKTMGHRIMHFIALKLQIFLKKLFLHIQIYMMSPREITQISDFKCMPRGGGGNLKVIYHPIYSMNNFVTNKSKLPQDGAQVFPYMG